MPAFEYRAVDAQGRVRRGLAHGTSVADAAGRLAAQGLEVQEIAAASGGYDPLVDDAPRLQPEPQPVPAAAAPAPAGLSLLVGEAPTYTGSGMAPPMVSQAVPAAHPRPGQEAPRGPEVAIPDAPPGSEAPRQEGPPLGPRSRLVTDFLGPIVGGVPLRDLHFFFRQFASMMEAGVGMSDSLHTLSGQSTHPKLKRVLAEASQHVVAGRPFSAAIQRYPEVFSPLIVSMVRTGEAGGFLSSQCELLADYLQRDLELRTVIRRETAYPKLIIFASIFIVGGANSAIAVLAPGRTGLWSPLTDPKVLAWVIPSLIVMWLAYRYMRKNPTSLDIFGGMVQHVPYFGPMVTGFAMAKFGRAFGALYRGGVPFHTALKLAADACGSENLRGRMYPAAQRLENGVSIYQSLAETRAFSPIVMDMVKTGEITGNIEPMMVKMAEYYEEEGVMRARQGALILGVLCLILVGIYVLMVALHFYGGYFNSMVNPGGG